MQYYDFSVSTGNNRNIDAVGNYLYYYAGSAGGLEPTIIVKEDQCGTSVILKPGQAFRMEDGQTANMWRISNMVAGVAVIGAVVIGKGEIWDNRITGEVSIIDGEKSRTLAGGMFGAAPFCVGSAGNYSNVQLWNPAGSNKNLIVSAMQMCTVMGTPLNVLFSATQLATLFSVNSSNKKAGGAAPFAQLRNELKLAAEAFLLGMLRNDQTTANVPIPWNIKGALVVPPGFGLNVYSPILNTTITTDFEWYEENL